MLSGPESGLSVDTGKTKVGKAAQSFSIRVGFVDNVDHYKNLTDENERTNNNAAHNDASVFDLIVMAAQATTKSN